jgi:hypothetical protein
MTSAFGTRPHRMWRCAIVLTNIAIVVFGGYMKPLCSLAVGGGACSGFRWNWFQNINISMAQYLYHFKVCNICDMFKLVCPPHPRTLPTPVSDRDWPCALNVWTVCFGTRLLLGCQVFSVHLLDFRCAWGLHACTTVNWKLCKSAITLYGL